MTVRLGTRGSKLAMIQAESVQRRLADHGWDVEIVKVATSGDKGDRDTLGAFVREIQRALLDHEVDLALHCLKDIPTTPVPGLALVAYLERDDPRDAMILRQGSLAGLPAGAVVGTGSLRRSAQIRAIRRDLAFKPLVGNVDTRMRKLRDGEYDAIMLAVAGLERMQIDPAEAGVVVEPFAVEDVVPAAGQGVLVLEGREGDEAARAAARNLHCDDSEVCAVAERAFLSRFGSGCSLPVAAHVAVYGDSASFHGRVVSLDGATCLEARSNGDRRNVAGLAGVAAADLVAQGALALLPSEVLA
jgi:hydroxymethylbilane synthase